MRKINSLSIILFALAATNANAFVADFIGMVVGGMIVGAATSAGAGGEGDYCVGKEDKLGAVKVLLPNPNGHTATIKSISGKSSQCKNPLYPIRAVLELTYSYTSKAVIHLPEGYESKSLTDTQKWQGGLLSAAFPAKKIGFYVFTRKRTAVSDPAALARGVETSLSSRLVDAKTSNDEQLKVSSMNAWRFEVTGKTKGIFGEKVTYLVTVLEGDQEYVTHNVWAPTDNYDSEKVTLKQLAENISGINATSSLTIAPPIPDSALAAGAPLTMPLEGDPSNSPVSTAPSTTPVIATPSPNTIAYPDR